MDTFTIIQESQPTKKVDISLRQLIDIDETGGITATNTRAVGKIENNQILTSFAEVIDPNGTLGKVKTFRFKNLSSLITGGTGITISTDKDGITTISATGGGGGSALIYRHEFNVYDYLGTAPTGSLEASNVWDITRLTIASDGSVTKGVATNVSWTGRYTHTYL